MNLYVETNFVLELVFMQEEHASCENLLKLAEEGKINLIVPAFALVEPYETLIRRDKERKQLAEKARAELRQLGRSKVYEAETQDYHPFVDLLTRSGIEEAQRLAQIQERLLKIVEVIPLTQNTLTAFAVHLTKGELSSPQDTLIYTHLIQHLDHNQPPQSCFITKNYNDFSEPDIEKALDSRKCKILYRFQDGYNYVHRS